MAKFITDENIRLNIIVNGNSAQKELLDLEKNTSKLNRETKDYKAELKKVEKELGKQSLEYKNLSAKIKENNATVKQNKLRMEELQQEIGLTGLTMRQLGQRAGVLRLAIRNAIPGSGITKELRVELQQVQARMKELSFTAQKTKLSLSSVANGFNKYAALGASALAATTGVVLGMQKMIDYNGKLSDAQSDVQKTTGLTKKEVDELTKSFGILNTRTSRMDLLKIAEEGGRIGIAKNEIEDFVRVMNKANVALGDSFTGGPEEVASKLGKLKLLFKETKGIGVERAYEAIGSAINELGANGVATEANIAEFATRIGSLPDALKPTIQDALGLGAAFEESGVGAETAGRSYSIFLGEAATRLDDFGKVMGLSAKEVENLINTNPTEFFLQFSQKLEETSKGGVDTAKTLRELGLSADGVKKIVGAAGNNVDRFRKVLDLSNKAMISSTSLTEEYNIKNNNLAATIEKVQKKLMAAFSSETLINGLTSLVNWIAILIGATVDVDGTVTKWKQNVISLIKIIAIAVVYNRQKNAILLVN
jgi:tubulin-specific chaperone A